MKRISIFVVAMFVCVATTFSTRAAEPKQGHLVIIGGGTLTDDIVGRIVEYGGGKENMKLLIVPYALRDTAYLGRNIKVFRDFGVQNIDYINCEPSDVDNNLDKLDGVTAIFFSGGYQRDLGNALRGTKFLERIYEMHRNGVVISGTSAGAAVMCNPMLAGGHRAVPEGKNPNTYGVIAVNDVVWEEGFGFIPEVIIHQHFTVRKRFASLFSALLDNPTIPGVGIDESTAIDVFPNGTFEVVGETNVMVIEPKFKKGETPQFNVLILYSGDKYKYK